MFAACIAIHFVTTIMIKVYVAGGWQFRSEAKVIQERVRDQADLFVTSTWIDREVTGMCPEKMAHAAKCDIDEVTEADAVLAIMQNDTYAYRGTFSEIGCALGQNKPVVILCPGKHSLQTGGADSESPVPQFSHYCMTNVFYWHPLVVCVETVEEAFDALLNIRNADAPVEDQ